jgi:hypothetical protein
MFTPAPGRPNSCLCTWHAVCSAHYENLPPDWTYSCTHHNRSVSTVAASIPYLLRARGVLHLFLVRSWPFGAGQLALAIPLYLHLPPAVPAPASWPCWGWLDTHHRFSACSNSRRTRSCPASSGSIPRTAHSAAAAAACTSRHYSNPDRTCHHLSNTSVGWSGPPRRRSPNARPPQEQHLALRCPAPQPNTGLGRQPPQSQLPVSHAPLGTPSSSLGTRSC